MIFANLVSKSHIIIHFNSVNISFDIRYLIYAHFIHMCDWYFNRALFQNELIINIEIIVLIRFISDLVLVIFTLIKLSY